MKTCLSLFHGRVDPKQDMEEQGTAGPVFVCDYVQVTYAQHIQMSNIDCVNDFAIVEEDLIYYDGVYYGDFSIFPEENLSDEEKLRIREYSPELTISLIYSKDRTNGTREK